MGGRGVCLRAALVRVSADPTTVKITNPATFDEIYQQGSISQGALI